MYWAIPEGLAIGCLSHIYQCEQHTTTNWQTLWIPFIGGQGGYLLLRWWHVQTAVKWQKPVWYFAILTSILAVWGLLFVQHLPFWQLVTMMALIGIYPLLRPFGLFKTIWVAATLAFITSFLLQKNSDFVIHELLIHTGIIWLWLFPKEIQQAGIDQLKQPTLPQWLGIRQLKKVSFIFGIILLLLTTYLDLSWTHQAIIVLSILVVVAAPNDRNDLYLLGVEMVPVLWLFLFQV